MEMYKQIQSGKPIHEVESEANVKKIYKGIFPKVQDQFVSFDKQKSLAEKDKLKQKANLADKPGPVKESASSKKDDWTYKDYLKERSTNQFGFRA